MKVRFQADADLNEDIVNGVLRRAPEIDFQTARDANLAGVKDLEVLAIAAREKRVLVTHDRRTMPQAFAESSSQMQKARAFLSLRKMPT